MSFFGSHSIQKLSLIGDWSQNITCFFQFNLIFSICRNNRQGEWSNSPKFSGKYTFNIPISSKAPSGAYEISGVRIADQAGDLNQKCVINNGNNRIDIKDAMINFSNSSYTAKKAFFDAIKGKDKTIVFSNDGILSSRLNLYYPLKKLKAKKDIM
ncbi:hypothetical protein [Anaerostipes caccae]|uniref:Uncharacterized protein n=1 Tax=Anaerostipes caccae (strain DSM 14662 / CCUG 47493 / JCM 13470 / NCIMB 13811 / L1-92) TaxID=411490 RepID=B0MFD7_ANACD|nr:hypothetical protein [Anaerostipes caccae]EDR97242.1 hypothetical protein ANACAC_02472 [Anaerostipes caccae L1-92]